MDRLRYDMLLQKVWSQLSELHKANIPANKIMMSPGDYQFLLYYVRHDVLGTYIAAEGKVFMFTKPVEINKELEDGDPDVDPDIKGFDWIGKKSVVE